MCFCCTEAERGNWKEEMTNESTTMLYRALHNLIERSPSLPPSLSLSLLLNFEILSLLLDRSLLSEHFLPLGKWFARPDSSVATDGRSGHLTHSHTDAITNSLLLQLQRLFSLQFFVLCPRPPLRVCQCGYESRPRPPAPPTFSRQPGSRLLHWTPRCVCVCGAQCMV